MKQKNKCKARILHRKKKGIKNTKVNPITKRRGLQIVKSVLVVKAYTVIPIVMPAVATAAAKTIRGSYLAAIVPTITERHTVKIVVII